MIDELKQKVAARTLTLEDIERAQAVQTEDPEGWEAHAWVRALAGAHEVDEWLYGYLQSEMAAEEGA